MRADGIYIYHIYIISEKKTICQHRKQHVAEVSRDRNSRKPRDIGNK